MPARDNALLIGGVSRLVLQKGYDLFARIAEPLIKEGVQFAMILSDDDKELKKTIDNLRIQYPQNVGVEIGYIDRVTHLIEAGSDAFQMFSKYEPCGLNQMFSMIYGTLPIVHDIGGLADTVEDGITGFKFGPHTAEAALTAAVRAKDTFYNHPDKWQAMQREGMSRDFSWKKSAEEYYRLYERAIHRRQQASSAVDWENITPKKYLNHLRRVFKYFKVAFALPVGIGEIDARLILKIWETLEEHYKGADIKQVLEAVSLKEFIALLMGENKLSEAMFQAGLILACGLLPHLQTYTDKLKEKINSGEVSQIRDIISRMQENTFVEIVRENQGDFAIFNEVTIAGVRDNFIDRLRNIITLMNSISQLAERDISKQDEILLGRSLINLEAFVEELRKRITSEFLDGQAKLVWGKIINFRDFKQVLEYIQAQTSNIWPQDIKEKQAQNILIRIIKDTIGLSEDDNLAKPQVMALKEVIYPSSEQARTSQIRNYYGVYKWSILPMYALSYEIKGKLKQGSPKELALVYPVFSGIYSLGRYAVDEEIRQYRADRNPKSLKKLAKLFIAAESLSKNNESWLWKAFFYSLLSDSLKDADKEITQAEVNTVIGKVAGKINEIKGMASSALVGALIQATTSSSPADSSDHLGDVYALPKERITFMRVVFPAVKNIKLNKIIISSALEAEFVRARPEVFVDFSAATGPPAGRLVSSRVSSSLEEPAPSISRQNKAFLSLWDALAETGLLKEILSLHSPERGLNRESKVKETLNRASLSVTNKFLSLELEKLRQRLENSPAALDIEAESRDIKLNLKSAFLKAEDYAQAYFEDGCVYLFYEFNREDSAMVRIAPVDFVDYLTDTPKLYSFLRNSQALRVDITFDSDEVSSVRGDLAVYKAHPELYHLIYDLNSDDLRRQLTAVAKLERMLSEPRLKSEAERLLNAALGIENYDVQIRVQEILNNSYSQRPLEFPKSGATYIAKRGRKLEFDEVVIPVGFNPYEDKKKLQTFSARLVIAVNY